MQLPESNYFWDAIRQVIGGTWRWLLAGPNIILTLELWREFQNVGASYLSALLQSSYDFMSNNDYLIRKHRLLIELIGFILNQIHQSPIHLH